MIDPQQDDPELAEIQRQAFAVALDRSRVAVVRVADWFYLQRRLSVRLDHPEMTPSYAARHAYSDQGDLWVRRPGAPRWHQVEVKYWERNPFTDRSDFPFPEIFVCPTYRWDRVAVRPALFVTVNPALTMMVWVRAASHPHWRQFDYHDRHFQGRVSTVYRVAIAHADFVPLDP